MSRMKFCEWFFGFERLTVSFCGKQMYFVVNYKCRNMQIDLRKEDVYEFCGYHH